jgi:hypothetical protein
MPGVGDSDGIFVRRTEEGIEEGTIEVEVVEEVIEGQGGIGEEIGWIIELLQMGEGMSEALGGTGIGGMKQEEILDLTGVPVDIRSRVDTG